MNTKYKVNKKNSGNKLFYCIFWRTVSVFFQKTQ